MTETMLSLDYPIVFVTDPSNPEVKTPEYSAGTIASATTSCVSVAAIAYVDGNVTVRLTGGEPYTGAYDFFQFFYGVIATPGKKVAVVTAENKNILELDVPE